jgi:type III secretion protein R
VFDSVILVVVLGLLPFLLIATTSFAKLSIVLGMIRSAFGAAEVPSGAIVTVLAALLSGYVMLPVARAIGVAGAPYASRIDLHAPLSGDSGKAAWDALASGQEPLRAFLERNSGSAERRSFAELLKLRLPETERASVSESDFAVVLPAFFITELKEALQMGFLLLLPFLVLDLVVASILTALGMQALPATSVALPFKLLLFVSVDGFRTLSTALVSGYS